MVIRYMLDTDTCIALIKNRPEAMRLRLTGLSPEEVGVSGIVAAELWFGVNHSKKKRQNEAQCSLINAYLRTNCSVSDIDEMDSSVCRDPNDIHVLGLAQHISAHFIVTGDKDLLDLGRFRDIRIVTPREFWAVAKEFPECEW